MIFFAFIPLLFSFTAHAKIVNFSVEEQVFNLDISQKQGKTSINTETTAEVTFVTTSFNNLAFGHPLSTMPHSTGTLRYRGKPLKKIVSYQASEPYEKVLALLLYGENNAPEKTKQVSEYLFDGMYSAALALQNASQISPDKIYKDPMDVLIRSLRKMHRDNSTIKAKDLKTSIGIIGSNAAIAAFMNTRLSGEKFQLPTQSNSFARNFLTMANLKLENEEFMNAYFDLLIGHGMNFSTSLLLQMASAQNSLLNTLEVALKALDSPAHGGAARETANMMNTLRDDRICLDVFLTQVENKQKVLYGFGHRIYKNGNDPRAVIFEERLQFIETKISDVSLINDYQRAFLLKEKALLHSYIRQRNLTPNVDYFAHLYLRFLGIDPVLSTVMFSVSRMGSWIADLTLQDDNLKIMRPKESAQ